MEVTHFENPDKMALQLALEREMVGLGQEQYRRSVEKAKENGNESETPYGIVLLRKTVEPLAKLITEFLEDAASGRAGRRHIAARYLSLLHPETAAFIIAKRILDNLTDPGRVQRVALSVAQALEDEVRFRFFREQNPAYFTRVLQALQQRTSNKTWRRKVMVHSMNKVEIDWTPWPEREAIHVGLKALDLFIQASGFAKIVTFQVGRRFRQQVEPTEELSAWISRYNARCELLSPAFLPCVVPPKPWTGAWGGGYYSDEIKPLPLVKTRRRNYLEDLNNRVDEMPAVFEAINAAQDTAWKVNKPVLDVMRQVWDRALPLGKLPSRDDLPLPPKPADIAENKEALEEWKRAAAKVYEQNARLRSKRLQIAKVIWIAEKFADEPAIYFPYQLDFRGRMYAVPMFLNPQGADWSRGLLTFAEGKPIGSTKAAAWLAIHGANCFGVDKVSYSDRVDWVFDNEERILAVAADPLAETWWAQADNPWQFLAFCFEWAGYCREGLSFVSSLPIQLDGSCNGLQHFSAMLRDPVGGAAVNLVPSDVPQDIYGRVAEVVVRKLEAMTEDATAQKWLAFGITRTITKRPVMVLPYGGTLHSCREYVYAAAKEQIAEGKANPFGDDLFKACMFLARVVWEAIGEVVVAARRAMTWLQKVASVAASEGLPIVWHTPVGFPVQQAYYRIEDRMVETLMSGNIRLRLRLASETENIDPRRQAQGISPNFVHSLDAAALMIYVVTARANGIDSFSLIHDSYGTVAADCDTMAACLREAFVALYRDNDPLADFRAEIANMLPEGKVEKLPPLPKKGDLDIEGVLDSPYFFA